MKKIYLFFVVAVLSFTSCHTDIWNSINDLDSRVKALEELCREMNTNINSLQTLVEVLQTNDHITNIVPIVKGGEVIGYTITFQNHEPITIYNGSNGENGGAGNAPIVGVAMDTDGVYYWTVNGEWLLDDMGNKIRVTGRDGQNGQNGQNGNDGQPGRDGQDGQDGQNGQNGADGQDGITPLLKIENGYWYVSYNNGTSWTVLGQATGADGQDGRDGRDGQDGRDGRDGENIFTNIAYDANNVYFTLTDGSVITIPRGNGGTGTGGTRPITPIIDGAIIAEFSVSDSTKVYFSQGHLEYSTSGTHLCADGTIKRGTWRFAGHQYYQPESDLKPNNDSLMVGWLTHFVFGSSGYIVPPYNRTHLSSNNISGTYNDWGVYNAISNGGNQPNLWRILTKPEIDYILEYREDAHALRHGCKVGEYSGILLLPDNWYDSELDPYQDEYTVFEFKILEATGAIFLPLENYGYEYYSGSWSTSASGTSFDELATWIDNWYGFYIKNQRYYLSNLKGSNTVHFIAPVRLVKDVPTSSNN